jgi:hypothetical protein
MLFAGNFSIIATDPVSFEKIAPIDFDLRQRPYAFLVLYFTQTEKAKRIGNMQKFFFVPLLAVILLSLAACEKKPACPSRTETDRYFSSLDIEASSGSSPENPSSPVEVKINGKATVVDQVVTGPLCNDSWKGTVYVACDVQVAKWEKDPLFLKGCNLSIEPNTVVYVAYHNDAAYYNGCSCHTGVQPQP